MRQLATQAGGGSSNPAGPVAAGGFAGELRASIMRINALQMNATEKGKAFQAGDPEITLNDLMIDKQKASVAFQFGLQVRNRLITAYRDVMNMQV
ncbi:MAG: flagellar hook-basal body complex protein FliE [Halochromatium sp.]|uniref:flagellar hook-basal body complex protein FliE n=1 Tax=Halochromatium sp. TaxID=2049430 RepID=UPI00397DF320